MLLNIVFYTFWYLLLDGVYNLTCELTSKFTKNRRICTFLGFFVIMSLLFEAILMKEEKERENETIYNQIYSYFFKQRDSDHYKWHVNPITVPISLLGRIIVLFFSIFGESLGVFVKKFFSELPLLAALISFPFTLCCCLIGLLCTFGYNFDIGYGFIKVESGSRLRRLFELRSNTPINKMDNFVKLVNENYQKAIR